MLTSFQLGTRVLSGEGALGALEEFGAGRVLVVSDPYFYENGLAQQVAQEAGGREVRFFTRVEPDPSVALAAEGTGVVKAFQPELVVALGGGSAMDLAKAMVYFAGSDAPLAVIPTTSGSGSEVTDFAILSHDGVKHPLVDPRLRPHTAILEPGVLASLPKGLIAQGGFDAISHAVEAYVGKKAGAVSDCLALEAFRRLFGLLPASFGGDQGCRLRLHEASTMAGMAFSQGGLGLCHGLSHALGGRFHLPHGMLNAILLPVVVGCNGPAAGERYARLARETGAVGATRSLGARNLKNALVGLRRELGLPGTLGEAGVELRVLRRETESLVAAVMADPCCATNPLPVEPYLVRLALEEAAGRG